MRCVRHIITHNFPFDINHCWEDENKFAVRLLTKINPDLVTSKTEVFDMSVLETTEKVSDQHMRLNESHVGERVFKKGENFYHLDAEYVFDYRKAQWQKVWTTNANFMFAISLWGERVLRVFEKRSCTYFLKWRSNWYNETYGNVIPCQLYVWQPSDNIKVISKSLVSKPNGLITNVDLSNSYVQSPEMINDDMTSSQRLEIGFRMTGPETVKPDGIAEFKVVAHDWFNNHIDINYDNFVIDAVDGYAPHRRFEMVNGVGTFKVIALGLKDGEQMRVKFGTKLQTGVRQCIVSVRD